MIDKFKKEAEKFNINLSKQELEKFEIYYNLLKDYNSHTNLVASDEKEEVFVKHFLDSLSIGLLKDKFKFENLLDIGVGAGFPSLPILIAFENVEGCLIESVSRKTRFLNQVVEALGMTNRVEVLTGRAEEIGFKENYREKFDLATARAVSHLSAISELCTPFLRKGGFFVPYKAKTADDEIKESLNAFEVLNCKLVETVSYEIKTDEIYTRKLVVIEKTGKTPAKYPRNTGIIKKQRL